MSHLVQHQPLSPLQIKAMVEDWSRGYHAITDDDLFIGELGFYNKLPDSTVDQAFRADLVVVNSGLIGFEIKSEKDNLKRWDAQKIAYTNVFNEVWLCCHHKHIKKAMVDMPKHIGILTINAENRLEITRLAVKDHGLNNTYDLSSMLWREELNELANLHKIKWKSRTNKREARAIIMKELSISDVMGFLIKKLKIRKSEGVDPK